METCALQGSSNALRLDSNIIGPADYRTEPRSEISRHLFSPVAPRDGIPTAGITEHV